MENNQKDKWYDNKLAVFLFCIFFFPVGLYALWKSNTISKGWKIGGTTIICIFALSALAGESPQSANDTSSYTSKSDSYASSSYIAEPEADSKNNAKTKKSKDASENYAQVGETLNTRYFDVTVNDVSVKEKVDTGNMFANLEPEKGNNYLIINTTFKNTDTESRMIGEGYVMINYNGKDFKFDKSETLMIEGWGIFLDQINPLTSMTTNIVYKIPVEISGPSFYKPGRSDDDALIYLGKIN